MRRPQVSPVVLVLLAVGSVQFGGALAATLIPAVGALGSVTLRLAIAAAVMLAVLRPRVRGYDAGDWATVAGFAVALASMNAAFYASLSRLPIGAAVTIEFVGPLLLAAVLSRLAKDFVAVAVAALGVVLVSGVIGTSTERLDPVGVVLALLAGASWAAYILLSARTGRRFPKLDGLALAMVIATLIVAPVGVVTAGPRLWHVDILLQGAAIAMLYSVIPLLARTARASPHARRGLRSPPQPRTGRGGRRRVPRPRAAPHGHAARRPHRRRPRLGRRDPAHRARAAGTLIPTGRAAGDGRSRVRRRTESERDLGPVAQRAFAAAERFSLPWSPSPGGHVGQPRSSRMEER